MFLIPPKKTTKDEKQAVIEQARDENKRESRILAMDFCNETGIAISRMKELDILLNGPQVIFDKDIHTMVTLAQNDWLNIEGDCLCVIFDNKGPVSAKFVPPKE